MSCVCMPQIRLVGLFHCIPHWDAASAPSFILCALSGDTSVFCAIRISVRDSRKHSVSVVIARHRFDYAVSYIHPSYVKLDLYD